MMNGNFECRVCMNVSHKVCNNFLNVCLSELERVNSYCYLGDNMNGGRESELAVTLRMMIVLSRRGGLRWKAAEEGEGQG